MNTDSQTILADFVNTEKHKVMREAEGELSFPFLEPGEGYHGHLWDWDSFFTGIALLDYPDVLPYLKGSAMNFLSNLREDGHIPYNLFVKPQENTMASKQGPTGQSPITVKGMNGDISPYNACKPLLSQMCAIVGKHTGDYDWIRDYLNALESYVAFWERYQRDDRFGLFVWRTHRGNGTDNHPALYGRPPNSVAGVDLNVFFVREYGALAKLFLHFGNLEKFWVYTHKMQALSNAINRHLWDSVDGMYYHADVLSVEMDTVRQKVDWVVPLKFKSWTSYLPMWCGIATKQHTERLMCHLTDDVMWSNYGIRTLAANERMYNTDPNRNPSNWQGPVWIISNYLVFCGFQKYGYKQWAQQLADRTVDLLATDIKRHNCMHEYYHPDTGEGIMHAGFLNWNLLGSIMHKQLEYNLDYSDY